MHHRAFKNIIAKTFNLKVDGEDTISEKTDLIQKIEKLKVENEQLSKQLEEEKKENEVLRKELNELVS